MFSGTLAYPILRFLVKVFLADVIYSVACSENQDLEPSEISPIVLKELDCKESEAASDIYDFCAGMVAPRVAVVPDVELHQQIPNAQGPNTRWKNAHTLKASRRRIINPTT